MKKCKSCGNPIFREEPKVTLTTGSFLRKKRELYHLSCFIADRKKVKS